jgi:hypothetical protein
MKASISNILLAAEYSVSLTLLDELVVRLE